jgi:3-oxoacyl-ACP reductase-like protein
VLGESESGKTPSSTNKPASTSAPAEAVQAKPASAAQHGSLPFTGTDVIAVVLAGCLMLMAGLGIRRLLASRA